MNTPISAGALSALLASTLSSGCGGSNAASQLAKLPADRFATSKDFADAVSGRAIASPSSAVAFTGAPTRATTNERRLAIATEFEAG